MEDTIAAIATPFGTGGLAVLRVSGPHALQVAGRIFVSANGFSVLDYPSHTIHFGRIVQDGHAVDQVLLSVMRAPRSYTCEDTVEISCHGGTVVARTILSLCVNAGARLAQPGEFTKRAFLNGRIDLTQAEAVMDLVSAKTERACASATNAIEGVLYRQIREIHQSLITILASVEAHINFPEEDIPVETLRTLHSSLREIRMRASIILRTANEGTILRHGVSMAIIGRPNVGKSSLLNQLLGRDRAIVSHIPGTTRDTIEETANIDGMPITFTDTAGIRSTSLKVEELGIRRSHKSIEVSDMVIYILDASKVISATDKRLLNLCKSKPSIVVANKADLPRRLAKARNFSFPDPIFISALTGDGIDILKRAIKDKLLSGITTSTNDGCTVNERQASVLKVSIGILDELLSRNTSVTPIEVLAHGIRRSVDAIGEIIGITTTEDLLQRIFSTFCIGK